MSYTTNITNARKNLYKLPEMAIENGVKVTVCNVVYNEVLPVSFVNER